ncbi:MAG: hypothetical protein AAGI14_04530 [Pseudomonadota bacterium]
MNSEIDYQNAVFARLNKIDEVQCTLRFNPFSFSPSENPVVEVTVSAPDTNWEKVESLLGYEVFHSVSNNQLEITDWDWDKSIIITGSNVKMRWVPYDRDDLLYTIKALTNLNENERQKNFKSSKLLRKIRSFLEQLKDRSMTKSNISSDQARLQRANLETIGKVLHKLSRSE